MKSKTSYRLSSKRIRSLHDIELEKAKLEVEILKSEDKLRSSSRHLIYKLTFRNLTHTLIKEISTSPSFLFKAVSVGKSLLEKRKKKKKEKEKTKMEEEAKKHEETKENQTNSNSL